MRSEIELATSLDNGVTVITLAPERVPPATIQALVARGAIVVRRPYRRQLRRNPRRHRCRHPRLHPSVQRDVAADRAANPARSARRWKIATAGAASSSTACTCIRPACAWRWRPSRAASSSWSPTRCRRSVRTIRSYELYGETITARDGVVRNAAGALAGSALDMATAVRNSVTMLGVPLEEAARMASTYPADSWARRSLRTHRAGLSRRSGGAGRLQLQVAATRGSAARAESKVVAGAATRPRTVRTPSMRCAASPSRRCCWSTTPAIGATCTRRCCIRNGTAARRPIWCSRSSSSSSACRSRWASCRGWKRAPTCASLRRAVLLRAREDHRPGIAAAPVGVLAAGQALVPAVGRAATHRPVFRGGGLAGDR